MVETDGLENRYARNGIVGSNPTASAKILIKMPESKPKLKWQRKYSAGGIVYRNNDAGVEVLIIHPNKWFSKEGTGKWFLPKGVIEDHESAEVTAVREVKEETGVTGEIEEFLGEIQYFFKWEGENIFKNVKFYLMKYVAGEPTGDDFEIHEARFVAINEALKMLDRKNERGIMEKAIKIVNGE